jgi:PAS domain S-box-containing protein
MYVHYIFDITEQKRVEKKLRQSEEKYRKQFEEALDAIFLGDAETGIILDCNHAATKLVGRKKSEIVGKHQKILHPPEEVEGEFSRTFRQHLTDKEGKILETQILTKNGEIKDVAIKANTFKMGDKQIVQGIFRDITEYKKIERALKESEAKYKSIIEQAPDLIVTLDAKGIVLSCNPALESEIGYDQNKIIGKHFLGTLLLSGIDPVYAQKQFTTIIEGENPEPIEVNWFPKDGTPHISEIRVGLIRKEGKVAGFTAVARDITERQRLKKALQESEERFRQVAENSLEWIWEVDPDGLYTYASPAVEKLLGYEPNDIVGKKHFYDFFHPEHRENLKKSAFSVFEEKRSLKGFINPNVDKDGNLVWLSTSGVPMLDDKGNLLGYRGADIDVTDRKKAEEEVEKMVTDLSLVIEKLGVVGKASRHDARNKLSSITNNVYLAKQQLAKNSPALEYLDNVESATEQIENIFDFARTYETIGVEEKSYVNVEKSFNEAVKLTSALGDTKIVNVCHGLTVLADSQLRQLFYNLINNSLTHGEKVTKIKLHCKIEENELKLIYEDDGVGISKLEKEKIFMEGYGKGTGYGLYLIRKICESYSWTIQETGKLRNGAQFTITVPKLIKDEKPTYQIGKKKHKKLKRLKEESRPCRPLVRF